MTRRSRRCRTRVSKLFGNNSDSDPGQKDLAPEVPKDEWVQCDREDCKKWRRLPEGTQINHSEKWFCSMHPDELYNDCSKEEEVPVVYGEIQNEFVLDPVCEMEQSGSQEQAEYVPHRCKARNRDRKNKSRVRGKTRCKENKQMEQFGEVQYQFTERNQQHRSFTDLISQHVAEMNGQMRTQQYLEAQAFKEDYELLENFKCVLLSTVDLYCVLERQETQHILNVILHYVPNIGQQCLSALELWFRYEQLMLASQQQQCQIPENQKINPLEAIMECKKTFVIAVLEAQIQIQICMGILNADKTPNFVVDEGHNRPAKKQRKGSCEETGVQSNEGESNSHESNLSHGTCAARLPPLYEQNSIDSIIAQELIQFSRSLQEAEQQQQLQNMLIQLVSQQQQQQQQLHQESMFQPPQLNLQQQTQQPQQVLQQQQQYGVDYSILDIISKQNSVNFQPDMNLNMQLDRVREMLQNCPNRVAIKDLSPKKQNGVQ